MIINGEKYACEACVRGHRVSNCQHHGKCVLTFVTSNSFCSLCTLTQTIHIPRHSFAASHASLASAAALAPSCPWAAWCSGSCFASALAACNRGAAEQARNNGSTRRNRRKADKATSMQACVGCGPASPRKVGGQAAATPSPGRCPSFNVTLTFFNTNPLSPIIAPRRGVVAWRWMMD